MNHRKLLNFRCRRFSSPIKCGIELNSHKLSATLRFSNNYKSGKINITEIHLTDFQYLGETCRRMNMATATQNVTWPWIIIDYEQSIRIFRAIISCLILPRSCGDASRITFVIGVVHTEVPRAKWISACAYRCGLYSPSSLVSGSLKNVKLIPTTLSLSQVAPSQLT